MESARILALSDYFLFDNYRCVAGMAGLST